mmetsp:Transcript_22769/g.51986  ORF Transcript_22769/g.51986 Transcript_22769/m.51986 type:complete len:244 (-) Transcript_22769:117-848(-)
MCSLETLGPNPQLVAKAWPQGRPKHRALALAKRKPSDAAAAADQDTLSPEHCQMAARSCEQHREESPPLLKSARASAHRCQLRIFSLPPRSEAVPCQLPSSSLRDDGVDCQGNHRRGRSHTVDMTQAACLSGTLMRSSRRRMQVLHGALPKCGQLDNKACTLAVATAPPWDRWASHHQNWLSRQRKTEPHPSASGGDSRGNSLEAQTHRFGSHHFLSSMPTPCLPPSFANQRQRLQLWACAGL